MQQGSEGADASNPIQQLTAGLNSLLSAPLQLLSSVFSGSAQPGFGLPPPPLGPSATQTPDQRPRYDYPYQGAPDYHRRQNGVEGRKQQEQQAPGQLNGNGGRRSGRPSTRSNGRTRRPPGQSAIY